MLIGAILLGSGEEGQVYRCASLDNSHICAIKWSSYKQQNIQEPRLVHSYFFQYVSFVIVVTNNHTR
jgi:hypothetical protein